ncbi:MAG: hypothetical protein HY823_04775 [Acidobacteria bacterium]|nr:hypothetical protein [Acidobacteriota bacterium]
MRASFLLKTLLSASCVLAPAGDPGSFETGWISSKPEVRTFRSRSKQWGEGLYQVAVWKSGTGIEVVMSILMPDYAKFLQGALGPDLRPLRSKGVIVIGNQVVMEASSAYEGGKARIRTLVKPYDRTTEKELEAGAQVVDPSLVPLIPRILPLKAGAAFSFPALDPVTNSMGSYSLRVVAEEVLKGTACWRAETSSFEGKAVVWVEKATPHRVLRVETGAQEGVTELIQ